MSSGDSSAARPSSSSAPKSDAATKLAPSNEIQANEQETASSSHPNSSTPDKANLVDSISDTDIQDHSMAPSHSNTSLGNANRVVTSLEGDALSLDEEMIQRGGDAGYFEITGVRRMDVDDLDKSRHVVSNDSVHISMVMEKGESGGSEDSNTAAGDKSGNPPNSQQPAQAKFVVVDVPAEEEDEEGESPMSSPKSAQVGEEAARGLSGPGGGAGGGMGGGVSGTAAAAAPPAAANGSSIQPNRFRRVNQYERGRWTVRDSVVTEEQADSLTQSVGQRHRQQQSQQQQQQEGGATGNTPPKTAITTTTATTQPVQRSDSGPDSAHIHALNELNLPMFGIGGGGGGGGGGGTDSVSDKDSSSVHMDRSSTAAETLSRNTSLSSIIAPEKSVDGDEVLHADTDTESVTGQQTGATGGGQNSNTHDQQQQQQLLHEEAPMPSPQPPPSSSSSSSSSHHHHHHHAIATTTSSSSSAPPPVPTSSSGAVPPPASTVLPREEQQQPTPGASTPSLDSDLDLRRVKDAMFLLQNELTQVLTSSSSSMEENRTLKDQKVLMYQENVKLKEELLEIKEELRRTKNENSKLSKELKELKYSLTRLASGGGSVVQQGLGTTGDDHLSLAQSSNDTASSNSQGVIT